MPACWCSSKNAWHLWVHSDLFVFINHWALSLRNAVHPTTIVTTFSRWNFCSLSIALLLSSSVVMLIVSPLFYMFSQGFSVCWLDRMKWLGAISHFTTWCDLLVLFKYITPSNIEKEILLQFLNCVLLLLIHPHFSHFRVEFKVNLVVELFEDSSFNLLD